MSSTRRAVLVTRALVVALVVAVAPTVAVAQDATTEAGADTAVEDVPVDGPLAPDPIVVDGPVRVAPEDGATVRLGSVRHFGVLELRARGDGMRPIIELGLDVYLYGLAEMPARWHEEALKAQAVAARTYAWHSIERGTFDDYDICATTACQVFRGAEVVLDPEVGDRWRAAVDDTSGQVLLDTDGRPILARYFSTSGGRTFANEEAFPSSGPRPYLVSIDDPDDALSPMHRWTVRFTRAEFDALAARGDNLRRVVPVASARRVGDVEDPRAMIRFTGSDGRSVEVPAIALRDFLSTYAPRDFPGRFPSLRDDGSAPLPMTVPSTRYEIEVTDDEVVLSGRGWGHGVGMGQYGARGRAERGQTYDEILAAYYNGLEPVEPDDVPTTIRVGLEVVSAPTTVRLEGPGRILAGGSVVVESTLGSWTVARTDGGFALTPPVGSDAELSVGATEVVSGDARLPGRDVTLAVAVNKPVLLVLEVTDEEGRAVATRELGLAESGRHVATWSRRDDEQVDVAPGTYRVALIGTDADGTVAGTATVVTVTDPPTPPVPPAAAADPAGRGLVPVVAVVVVAIALAGALVVRARRRLR